MYLIIVGAGDIGTPLIEIASRSGNDVVVIEQLEEKADKIAEQYDCLVLHADATERDTLLDAGADEADAIISTTDKDATNIMVCMLADELEIPSVLSVVHNPDHMELYRRIGVETMENPQELIAEHLYRSVARPAIVDYMRIGDDAEVFEITVVDGAEIAGQTLKEAGEAGILSDDVLVLAIERNGNDPPITPRGGTTIQPGDLVTVYSGRGATAAITDLFGHYEDHL